MYNFNGMFIDEVAYASLIAMYSKPYLYMTDGVSNEIIFIV